MKGKGVAGSSPEQAAAPPKHPKREGASGSGEDGPETEELTGVLYESAWMRDRIRGWAKALAIKTVQRTKT